MPEEVVDGKVVKRGCEAGEIRGGPPTLYTSARWGDQAESDGGRGGRSVDVFVSICGLASGKAGREPDRDRVSEGGMTVDGG